MPQTWEAWSIVNLMQMTNEQRRHYFGNSGEPFSVTIMGEPIYILTSPEDVVAVYKLPKPLDPNPVVQEILRDFGLTKQTVKKIYSDNFRNGKHYMDASHDDFKLQFHPGEKLTLLEQTLLGHIDKSLTWQNMSGRMLISGSKKERTVSLYKWCAEVIVDAGTRALVGDLLHNIAPDILPQFFIFEEESWKLAFQYPVFAAKNMYSAKQYCDKAFCEYLRLPKEKRAHESWIMGTINAGLETLKIEQLQRAPTMFSVYRLVNTNAYKLAFWLLTYIIYDSAILHSVRKEIEPAFNDVGSLNLEYLIDSSSCPLLAAAYEETLRCTNWPMGYRKVVSPCIINGRTLRTGRKLLMPYRIMHFDPDVFGADAAQFNPRRFLHDKKLVKSTSFRPFGGAANHCPGRFLARREVLMFTALLLNRFDISLAATEGGQEPTMPRLDDTLPTGGILGPVAGDDVVVKVKRLSKS
ncbi:MAG: hypothetical protein Q9160_006229 [Pyrenula sp. 1 TL-2023]